MNPNTISLFRIPRKGHSYINLVPRAVHVPALMSAGLLYCYKNIKDEQPLSYAEDLCTNEEGCFCPVEGMKPMAWRFQFVEVIGRGQSAVLIKALDMFQDNKPVAIKVLHKDYSILGCQEADCLRNLNGQDPEMYSPVLRIYSTFKFGCHFCLVFEILHTESLLSYFERISEDSERLASVCRVAAQLVKAVGFLQSQNTIHADLKPENLLMKRAGNLNSMKVIDFGNAIRCIHDEMSLYYEDFELQTLLYRAPEVIYGMMFGSEVDMWSIGCILIELYTGHPLFFGVNKASVLFKMTELLGPLPRDIFQRGKFYGSLDQFTERNVLPKSISDIMAKIGCRNYAFIDFVSKLLVYDPAKRMSAVEAAIHPFLASELGLKYFPLRPPNTNGVSLGYSTVLLSPDVYPHQPEKKACTIEIAPFPLIRSHDTSVKEMLLDCRLNKIIKSEMNVAELEISIEKCSSIEQIPGGIDRNKNCMTAEDENYLLANSSLESSARIQKTVLNNHSVHEIGSLLKNRSSELSVTFDTTEGSRKVSPQRTKSLTKVNSQRAKCSEKVTPHRTKSPPKVTSESTRSATKERNIKNSRSVEQKIQTERTPDKNENFIMPEIINPPDTDWMLKFRPSNYKHKFSEMEIEKAKKELCVLKRNEVGRESISEIQCTSGQGYSYRLGFKENSATMKAKSDKTNQNNDSGFCSTVEEAKLLKDNAVHDYKDLCIQKQPRSAARRSFSENLSNNGSDSILNTTFSIPADDKIAKSLPRRSGSTLVIESKFNVCSAEISTPQKISSDDEEFGNESACNQTFTVNLDETFVKDRLKVNKRASKRKYSRRSVNRSGQKNVSCTDDEAFRKLNSSKITDSSCHKKLFSDSNEANLANSAYSATFSNKTPAKSSKCLNETIDLTSPTNSQKRNCSKKRKRSIVGQRKLKIKLESGTRYQNNSTLDSCESDDSNVSGYSSVLHHKYVGEGVDQESFDDVIQLSPESLSN